MGLLKIKENNLIKIFLGFILLSLCTAAQAEDVKIGSDFIQFRSGKRISFSRTETEKANGSTFSSFEIKPLLISKWRRVIILEMQPLKEDSEYKIQFFDFNGDLIAPPLHLNGELTLVPLEEKSRLFVGIKSSHVLVSESLVLDANGKIIGRISQDQNVFKFQTSEDGSIIWILSSFVRSGKPFTKVKAFDFNGKTVGEFISSKADVCEFNYAGKKYVLKIESPQFPG